MLAECPLNWEAGSFVPEAGRTLLQIQQKFATTPFASSSVLKVGLQWVWIQAPTYSEQFPLYLSHRSMQCSILLILEKLQRRQ